ncbi:DUF4190 domain-containing protein [Nocardia sp. NPDC019395]|uniref:DUF4190 domain-containing protein n=1 Tax=Nocardia sp. NPDC019395 TaxID=3154686 RepID=UPI0033D4C9AA
MSYPTPPPGYGYPGYGPPQDHPQATTILVLGIVSLFCALCGPFAWVMGKKALNEIDASGGAVGGRSNVMVGYVLGIITSVLMILYVIALIFFIVIAVVGASA